MIFISLNKMIDKILLVMSLLQSLKTQTQCVSTLGLSFLSDLGRIIGMILWSVRSLNDKP